MTNKQQLAAEYVKVFGKKPYGAWTEEELKAKIDVENSKTEPKEMTLEDKAKKLKELSDKAIELTDKKKTWDEMTEEERMIEAKKINSMQHTIYKSEKIVPVFIVNKETNQPEPYAIVGNKYIPWKEAEIMVEENKIKKSQAKLKKLTCA